MDIKPVRSSKDHRAALAEVERLWEAKPGTPEHDRLEVLVTLIEAYEAKHHPIPPPLKRAR
jgi:HTH-type transcriptional regulator/antitoxin HigA